MNNINVILHCNINSINIMNNIIVILHLVILIVLML